MTTPETTPSELIGRELIDLTHAQGDLIYRQAATIMQLEFEKRIFTTFLKEKDLEGMFKLWKLNSLLKKI